VEFYTVFNAGRLTFFAFAIVAARGMPLAMFLARRFSARIVTPAECALRSAAFDRRSLLAVVFAKRAVNLALRALSAQVCFLFAIVFCSYCAAHNSHSSRAVKKKILKRLSNNLTSLLRLDSCQHCVIVLTMLNGGMRNTGTHSGLSLD